MVSWTQSRRGAPAPKRTPPQPHQYAALSHVAPQPRSAELSSPRSSTGRTSGFGVLGDGADLAFVEAGRVGGLALMRNGEIGVDVGAKVDDDFLSDVLEVQSDLVCI